MFREKKNRECEIDSSIRCEKQKGTAESYLPPTAGPFQAHFADYLKIPWQKLQKVVIILTVIKLQTGIPQICYVKCDMLQLNGLC